MQASPPDPPDALIDSAQDVQKEAAPAARASGDASHIASVRQAIRFFAGRHRKLIAGYASLISAGIVLVALVPLAISHLVKNLSGGGEGGLRRAIGAVACVWLLKEVSSIALKALDQVVMPRLRSFLGTWVTMVVLRRPPPTSNEGQVEETTRSAARLPEVVTTLLAQLRQDILPALIRGLGIVCGFWTVRWQLGALSTAHFVLSVGLLAAGVALGVRRKVKFEAEARDLRLELSDILGNGPAIHAAGTVQEELANAEDVDRRYIERQARTGMVADALWNVVAALNAAFVAGGLLWLMFRISKGEGISGASAGAVAMLFYQNSTIEAYLSEYVLCIQHTAAVREVEAFLGHLPPAVEARPDEGERVREALQRHGGGGVRAEVAGVDFDYGGSGAAAGERVFVDLSLAFAAGGAFVLRAPIGAGKTTLLRLLLGELLPRAGTVRVGGLDPATLSQAGRAGLIAYVPQAPTLFDRSILDNVLYGLEQTPANIAAVQRLFVDYGLVGDPAWSLQRRVGPGGAWLSGGQRRLVALLRLHMAAARGGGGGVGLVIADEPLSNIGGKMRVVAKRLLELISRGRTLIVVSHAEDVPRFLQPVALPPSPSFTAAHQ